MPSGFVNPITIKEAIDHIFHRRYLLPAIQRKFVWSSDQIEVLFDSIMRGYPINSFMLWYVTDSNIKNQFKFYQFLTEYREFFKEDNPDIDTKSTDNFHAVIDGQQRLTSIYLGLKGSYAYKLPRRWWQDNEDNLPTRHLYLNLSAELPEDNERQMVYDFRFLTKKELKEKANSTNEIWFKVNNILKYKTDDDLDNYIDQKDWLSQKYTKTTIRRLRKIIFEEKTINYFLEKEQKIDKVLDIFIRTNSGGQSLSFSDLLMSITTANWQAIDARKEIPDVVKKVFEIGKPGFLITKDFVLKTCLVLFNENLKFQIKNFDRSSVMLFEQNWGRIKKCIIESFKLLEQFGFNNEILKAKNAVIPIIYFVYHKNLEDTINKPNSHKEIKKDINKWLCISILKGIFGGQSDNVLAGVRRALRKSSNGSFPFDLIKSEFRQNASKNLSMDDDFIDGLLTLQKDNSDTYPLLSLLYSHLNFGTQTFHKDHLHPASYFKNLKKEDCGSVEEYEFLVDRKNWDTIPNLQLLNGVLNLSKQDESLKDWVEANNIDKQNQLIDGIDLDIKNFKLFYEQRSEFLKTRIKEIIK